MNKETKKSIGALMLVMPLVVFLGIYAWYDTKDIGFVFFAIGSIALSIVILVKWLNWAFDLYDK